MEILPNEMIELIVNASHPSDYSSEMYIDRRWYQILAQYIQRRRIPQKLLFLYTKNGKHIDRKEDAICYSNSDDNEDFTILNKPSFTELIEHVWRLAPEELIINLMSHNIAGNVFNLPTWWLESITKLEVASLQFGYDLSVIVGRMPNLNQLKVVMRSGHGIFDVCSTVSLMRQIKILRLYLSNSSSHKSILSVIQPITHKTVEGLQELTLMDTNNPETFNQLKSFLQAAHFATECRLNFHSINGSQEEFFDWIETETTERPKRLRSRCYQFTYNGTKFDFHS